MFLCEGTGVGGCGACVGCAPVAPWSALASLGKLGSDIVTKDRVNVQVNQRKLNYFAAPEVEVLVCRADRTTKLLLNKANVNQHSSIRNSRSRRFLCAK